MANGYWGTAVYYLHTLLLPYYIMNSRIPIFFWIAWIAFGSRVDYHGIIKQDFEHDELK